MVCQGMQTDGADFATLYGVRVTCETDWPPEGDYTKIEFSMDKTE